MNTQRGTHEVAGDVLGDPFRSETIELRPDADGPVVATLVSRRAPVATTRAVLYIHGYSDYFFQTELAEWWVGQGYDFYAIDLRRYGRSLRSGQTPYFIRDLSLYFEELNAALDLIRERDGHDRLVVNAHSTGGLVASLWADSRKGDGLDALVLNSPWLELQTNWFGRRFASGVVRPLGVVAPKAVLKKKLPTSYPESLHRDHNGEWDFDFDWKPFAGDPIYAGWMRAIRRGHAKVHRGLEVGVPILLLISARTYLARSYDEQCHEADVVVDVRQTARKVHRLTATQHVSVMRFEGAVHDVVLSREPVRQRVYAAMGKWLEGYVA